MPSSISWTDETWNPTVGCRRVSPGCENCYAERVAHRGMSKQHRGLTVLGKSGIRWNGKVNLVEDRLLDPLRWRKPRKIFVDSMSDLFYSGVPQGHRDLAVCVMLMADWHTFQVLTKRAPEMRAYFADADTYRRLAEVAFPVISRMMSDDGVYPVAPFSMGDALRRVINFRKFPCDWLWLGVSIEDQQRCDERLMELVHTRASVRFVSYEPALEDVDFGLERQIPDSGVVLRVADLIHQIIIGGESGGGARPFNIAWLRNTIRQCRESFLPLFVKQIGSNPIDCTTPTGRTDGHLKYISIPKGGVRPGARLACAFCDHAGVTFATDGKGEDAAQWPEGFRIRQWPTDHPMLSEARRG